MSTPDRVRKSANVLSFRCPGCEDIHTVPVRDAGGEGRGWHWNGSLMLPTLTPSIAVRSGHYGSAYKAGDPCWCGTDYGFRCYVCHSWVSDGRVVFLNDCTHALAGQTVDLPPVPDSYFP
jgi:Family of unknown function (DUF6527)